MPIEVDVFNIGVGLHKYRIAVHAGVDPLLNGRIVNRNVNYGRPAMSAINEYMD
jgi:hypothetical protein